MNSRSLFLYLVLFSNLHTYFLCNSSMNGEPVSDKIVSNQIGRLAIYNSKYVFPLRLYQDNILGEYDALHAQFANLYELISNSSSNGTDSVVSLLIEELHEWKHDYFSSKAQVYNLFNWELNGKTRQKRGLINAGGSLLKLLFGTAEHKDIISLNATLAKVFEHSKLQDVEINLHTHILNVTTKKINRINIVQRKLSNLISDLDTRLQESEDINQVIEQNVYNSNTFSSLILALMNLQQKTATLREGIIDMIRGTLSPAVVENDMLRNLLELIKGQGHSLLIDDNDISLNFYYDISIVNTIFEQETNSILFLVSIPINLQFGQTFNLYKVYSLYHSTGVSNIFTKFNTMPYVAINKDGSMVEFDNLLGCQRINTIYVCGLETEINNAPENSCTFRLMKVMQPYHPICTQTVLKLHKASFRLINKVWHYAIPKPMELYVHCKENLNKRSNYEQTITISGAGSIKLDQGCTATNNEIHLMATSKKFFQDSMNISMVQEYLPSYSGIE